MPDPDPPAAPPPAEASQPHGCVTLFLVWVVVANVLATLLIGVSAVVSDGWVRDSTPGYESWMAVPFLVLALVNIRCAFSLFRQRMWGFVGMWVVGFAGAALNLYAGMKPAQVVLGFVGLVVLYWLLQLGGEKSTWSRLK
ncbi:MAG: hypothetical protein U0804_03750 [Gemmataceae bacterium]